MKFALFNQLQMPRPWRQHEEVRMYKEAITEAVHAEAVGFDAYWQTEHHFMLGAGRTTHDQVMRALDLLGEKVIPKFREPVAAHAPLFS